MICEPCKRAADDQHGIFGHDGCTGDCACQHRNPGAWRGVKTMSTAKALQVLTGATLEELRRVGVKEEES